MSGKSCVVKIGCDPELFLKDKKTGKHISAHNLLPGTKEKPYPVDLGAIQVDGVAAEFNITPTIDSNEWVKNISAVMSKLATMVPGAILDIVPSVVFEPTYFKTLPEKVKQLGCNVDWCAWTGLPNPSPDGENTTMRTAAGHIHIGWTEGVDPTDPSHIEDCCAVVKQLDYYLGVPSLLWDGDNTRRTLYGKAGAFRPKSYGLEYRTLSNRWLINNALMVWVWYAAYNGFYSMISSGAPRLYEKYGEYARTVINENNTQEAMYGKFRKEIFTSRNVQVSWPTW